MSAGFEEVCRFLSPRDKKENNDKVKEAIFLPEPDDMRGKMRRPQRTMYLSHLPPPLPCTSVIGGSECTDDVIQ